MKKILLLFLIVLLFTQCVSPPSNWDTNPPAQEELNLDDLAGATVGYGGMYQFFDFEGTVPTSFQDGSHQVIPWYLLEPTVGNYNWSRLTSYVADRAGYGLHIGLGFNTVDYSSAACGTAAGSRTAVILKID